MYQGMTCMLAGSLCCCSAIGCRKLNLWLDRQVAQVSRNYRQAVRKQAKVLADTAEVAGSSRRVEVLSSQRRDLILANRFQVVTLM